MQAVALASLPGTPAVGQWAVTAQVGLDHVSGGSSERGSPGRSLRPYHPTTFGVGVERRSHAWVEALHLTYTTADLALDCSDAVVAAKGIFDVYGAGVEIGHSVTRLGANELLAHAGPLFELWDAGDRRPQARVGLQAGLSFRTSLGGKLAGVITAGASVMPSPFGRDQLDPRFERRPLWRRRLAGGLRYRL